MTDTVIHRDRDYMTQEEAVEYEAIIKKACPRAYVFLTRETDAESYFLNPDHFKLLFPNLEVEKLRQLIEQATKDIEEHSKTAFINSRTPIEAAKLRKENKQLNHGELALTCSKLYDANVPRYRHGKKVLRRVRQILQTEQKLNPSPYKASEHIKPPELLQIAVEVWEV